MSGLHHGLLGKSCDRSNVTKGGYCQRLPRFYKFDGAERMGGGFVRIIKRGLRKNCFRRLHIYSCKDCEAYFVSLVGLKGVQYPPRVIARTLCLYNLGHTQEEAARRIATEHRITVPRRTISHWISGYRPITTFPRLRNVSVRAFGGRMLKERTLEHQQTYEYKVHLSKLAFTAYFLHL
jgi:hypothetical protein